MQGFAHAGLLGWLAQLSFERGCVAFGYCTCGPRWEVRYGMPVLFLSMCPPVERGAQPMPSTRVTSSLRLIP